MSILSFIKQKLTNDSLPNLDALSKYSNSHNVTLAMAAERLHDNLNYNMLTTLHKMAKKETNARNQQGYLFKDGSVILKIEGQLKGLNIDDSSLWRQGLGYEPFSVEKYQRGQSLTVRGGMPVEVLSFDPNHERPITVKIQGHGTINYYANGYGDELQMTSFDLLMVPNTDPIFAIENKKQQTKKSTLS